MPIKDRQHMNWHYRIRRAHRYLGLFLALQFIMWTISGLYFSWTDLDHIHGDHFKKLDYVPQGHNTLLSPSILDLPDGVRSLELKDIGGEPFYWINGASLYHAQTGEVLDTISTHQATMVVRAHLVKDLTIKDVELIREVGQHHEYRGRALPAYVFSFEDPSDLRAYVSASDGTFQRVRHSSWRWFDFLWMMHTMDYQGRDNFNNTLLRIFSLLGLITVASGVTLWFVSSPAFRKTDTFN